MVDKHAKILIVGGAGTMGSSSALHLARRGYTDIRVLDMFQPPSANSAGNDINKNISTQLVKGIWGRLCFETWDAWSNDPLFQPFLHATGRIEMATRNHKRTATLRRQYELNREAGRGHLVEWLDNEEEIGRKVPFLKGANIKGYNGMWLEEAGWVEARESLRAVGAELQRLGVKSSFGTSGTFKDLLLGGKDGKKVVGVRTADGTEWPADLVIMATGAWSPVLLDLEGQCISKSWQFGHIQLTPEETRWLRNTPPLYCEEIGFFMEPTPEGVMKFSDEFEGYINTERCRPFGSKEDVMLSVPRAHALNPTDTIPDSGVEGIQKIIDTFLPRLSGRKLFDTAICWCTDSFDGNWLLCDDPRYEGLVLATGDSGHTFKMLPIVGKYVADLIEGKLSDEDKELWRWRPDRKRAGDIGRDGPVPRELREYTGWKHDQAARSKL